MSRPELKERPLLLKGGPFLNIKVGHSQLSNADLGSADDESASGILVNLFEAALLGKDEATVRALMPRLAPFASELSLVWCAPISIARLLGEGATLLGQREDARRYLEQASDACAAVGHRPESALARLVMVELLLTGTSEEQAEAVPRLDVAIEEFRAMKMRPSLERALSHKGLLHA